MSKLDAWIDNKLVQNLFIWCLLFLILLTTIQADNRPLTAFFIILLLLPAVYLNNLVILPFLKKNKGLCIGLFLVNTALFTAISVLLISTVGEQTFRPEMFINFFGIMLLVLGFASAIKIARDSFTRRQQEKEAELKLLKGQLNPHFLFNTLNNLYGLSVVKSDKLPDLMLKLSDLLRYSLYETKETVVDLTKEITYLENYIALEKIRLEDSTEITFTKDIPFASKKIAPMLFIVFVENAFKHLGAAAGKKQAVHIAIQQVGEQLEFHCTNTIDTVPLENENPEQGKSGIGLQNAKKRLALMYPEKHSLQLTTTSDTFTIALTLDI